MAFIVIRGQFNQYFNQSSILLSPIASPQRAMFPALKESTNKKERSLLLAGFGMAI
jgi:hypothetical protein